MCIANLKLDLNDIEALLDAVEIRLDEQNRAQHRLRAEGFSAAESMSGHIAVLSSLQARLMKAVDVLDAD